MPVWVELLTVPIAIAIAIVVAIVAVVAVATAFALIIAVMIRVVRIATIVLTLPDLTLFAVADCIDFVVAGWVQN